ncbi:MAG: CRTAC1 family protein [Acidobacteriia bacterium]|nr:CRTAC1 family protein [Terriglobia bacterium]
MKLTLSAVLLLCSCAGPRPASIVVFQEAASQTGLTFVHNPQLSGEFFMPEIMGAGVAWIDYDNDGDLDVYLIQAKPQTNQLFRNELIPAGRLQFTDVTKAAGVGLAAYGMGVATGDYDNDGFVDLYITNFGPNVLFHNNGNGVFTDVTAQAGVGDPRWSTSAAFLDYDRDGDLDLFVLNYIDFTPTNNKACFAPSGERDYCTPKAYNPVNATLYRNEGNGKFSDVSARSGITAARGPGLGVTITDANEDGWPDLFVANDTAANLLWINRKDGSFREQGLASGVAYSEDGLAKAGMGVAAGDYNNDGDEDLFVVNLTREGATLFRRDGPLLFQDASLATGLRPMTFSYTGFGAGWLDYDNDGFLDLFIANGAVTIIEQLRGQPYPFQQPNLLLHNQDGKKFSDVSASAGPALQLSEVSRGAAFGDVDNDGDSDILVANNNGPARLLLNQIGNRNPSITVQLSAGLSLNARVGLIRKGSPTLWRRAHSASSYLSASDPRVLFATGGLSLEGLLVEWPDGYRERFPVKAGSKAVTLRRGAGQRN